MQSMPETVMITTGIVYELSFREEVVTEVLGAVVVAEIGDVALVDLLLEDPNSEFLLQVMLI